jgi:hypothetical protein
MADNFMGKSISAITGHVGFHLLSLLGSPQLDNTVKEVRVSSSTYSAESGRNSGAQIQVVTKNGTNELHGSGFFKYNDPDFNAFNRYGGANNAPPQRVEQLYRQFGGSLV